MAEMIPFEPDLVHASGGKQLCFANQLAWRTAFLLEAVFLMAGK